MKSCVSSEQVSKIYHRLYEIGKSINETASTEELYNMACEFATNELNYEKALIFEHDDSNGWFKIVKSKGYNTPVEQKILRIINLLLSGEVIEYLRINGEPIIHTEKSPKKQVQSLVKSLFLTEAYFELFGGDSDIPYGLIVVGNGMNDASNFSTLLEDSILMLALGNFTVQLSNTINNIVFYKAWQSEKENLEKNIIKRTQQIEAQKIELETHRNHLQKIFHNRGSGIIIVDKNKVILEVNPKVCEMWGYLEEEILGQHIGILQITDQSAAEFREITFEKVLEQTCIEVDCQMEKKSGLRFWVQFSREVLNTQGDILWVINDVTELKESQEEIKKIHRETQDSIQYASLIQQAIIPEERNFVEYFSDFLTLWKPKDIVGGDIYLLEELRNKDECLLMVIDCTGHGVPGAFVTMLVKAIERQVKGIISADSTLEVSPAWILSYFNVTMKKLLKQEIGNTVSNVGFDGGVIYFNKKTNILKFAGAGTPLFYVEDNELKTIKGDRHSVGYKRSKMDFQFREHMIEVKDGMKFYLTTDGYFDQNGGYEGLPMGKKKFKEILKRNCHESFVTQKIKFINELKNHQKSHIRNDDITLIAFEI